jgi:hypothetical protein
LDSNTLNKTTLEGIRVKGVKDYKILKNKELRHMIKVNSIPINSIA